jgi:excinuclease ABC subunit A
LLDVEIERVVPDRSKTLRDGAMAPWATPGYRPRLDELLRVAPELGIPTDVPFERLSTDQVRSLVEGSPAHGFSGLRGFFRSLESKAHKVQMRVFLSRWRGYTPCPACGGSRLRPEALAIKLGGLDIAALSARRVREVREFLDELSVRLASSPVARRLLAQTCSRLDYLDRIGLAYLTLDRPARTLSGGEAQRVALTSALGSGLVSALYVLDEPSAGLHPADMGRLISAVHSLRDAGNTVVLVEHDHDVIRASDLIVDLGPGAGEAGGQLLYVGPPGAIASAPQSVTAEFLSGLRKVPIPGRRPPKHAPLRLTRASGHNLKAIDVEFPLGLLCLVAGVSGSGKSTLVEETLFPALCSKLGQPAPPAAPYGELFGTSGIDAVVLVDQSPIGRSARSNPVTYLKAFDEIRKTFAATHEAKLRNYDASRFSFNVEGGRCDACEGNGFKAVDMQFLPEVLIRCPECKGRRYRTETLEITYRGRNIAEVLDLTAREAFGFFRHRPKVLARLRPLIDVGLEYLRLGQPASTLSGGEAQRLKVASYLASTPGAITRAAGRSHTLFLLDEPTTGLHSADTLKLIEALTSLLTLGHSLILIEHSPEVMAAADWIIELGPGAGDKGGWIVAQGTPEEIAKLATPTGRVLAKMLGRE